MSGRPAQVLVVDPDTGVSAVVRAALPKDGVYNVDVATSVDQAQEQIHQAAADYDVVLISETLPRNPGSAPAHLGLELLEKLKVRNPSTEILFLATNGHSSALAALRAGAFHYLEKPLSDPAEVAIFIERAVQLHDLKEVAAEVAAPETADSTPPFGAGDPADRPLWDSAQLLQAVRSATLAISSSTDRTAHLQTIIEHAVTLLGARTAGVYRYDRERAEVTLVADSLREHDQARSLKAGEGLAGRLVQEQKPYITVSDYDQWLHRSPAYPMKSGFGSLLGVPVVWQGETIGCLYVNDEAGRLYTSEDADVLSLLAQQAAIALVNAEHLTERAEKLARIEKLSHATQQIMADLANAPLEDRLTAIARHATRILDAETCGVFSVKKKGVLTLVASYGHKKRGGFRKGREIEIREGEKTGLTGFIASTGKLLNTHGDELTQHEAVRGKAHHTPSGECHSLLAIPLFRRQRTSGADPVEEIVGLLRVDNKLGENGKPRPELRFTKEDEWILEIFAEEVVVAIESAELVDRLKEETDYKDGLINSSPNGIITIDTHGIVIEFNAQAERILGHKARETRGGTVRHLYFDPTTPNKIGAELEKRDGLLTDYHTLLRHRDGYPIPIRISAISLYDARGERIGSAGFFEDLRALQQLEERQDLLLQASKVVVEARELREGLKRLAEMVLGLLPHTFCRILLSREDPGSLVVEATQYVAEPGTSGWLPGLGTEIVLDEWPGFAEILQRGDPIVLHPNGDQQPLERLSKILELNRPIQSLFLVPLKIGDRVSGLLEVGELRSDERQPITKPERDLAVGIAAHTAVLIDRIRLHRITDRRKKLAEALSDVMVLGETEKTLESVTESTRAGTDCDAVTLYAYDAASGKLMQPPKAAGLRHPERIFPEFDATSSPIVQTVLRDAQPVIVADTRKDPRTRSSPFTMVEGIQSLIAVPLRAGGEPEGVMFVSYRHLHRFSDAELNSIKLFANQAAIAIQNAQRHEMVKRHKEELEVLHHAASAMSSAIELGAVRQEIVKQAREMFGATSAIFWPFDRSREEFLLEGLAAEGFLKDELERTKQERPEPAHLCYRTLGEGWIGEEVVDYSEQKYLSEPGRELMQPANIRSFQGIALRVGEEPLGVLFLRYDHPQKFSDKERKKLENFASYAALSLKKSRLIDQRRREKLIAEIVATVSTVGEPDSVLVAVASMTPAVARCDTVRLYIRDSLSGGLSCYFLKQARGTETAQLVSEPVEDDQSFRPIIDHGKPIICDRTAEMPSNCGWLADHATEFSAWVAMPMAAAGQAVGIFFVGYKEPRHFLADEIDSISLLSRQTATAVANNLLYEQSQKRADALKALYNASRTIAQSSLDLEATIDAIGAQALEVVGSRRDESGSFSYVALREGATAKLISASPPKRRRKLLTRMADIGCTQNVWTGIASRAVREKRPMNVGDVAADPDYIYLDPKVRSQLTVPILFEQDAIGFVSVEKRVLNAFSLEDVQNVELLAAQAAVAIQNARQYSELKKTRGIVGARTALAWMGMMAASWRHDIESDSLAIRGQAKLLMRELPDLPEGHSVGKRLRMIYRLANQICQRPITPPLGSDEGVERLRINEMVRDWTKRLWVHKEFRGIQQNLVLDLPDDATVLASPKWLRRAFDYVLRNAAQAIARSRPGKITLSTRRDGGRAFIGIQDTGPGIPPEIRESLFRKPIEKPAAEKGLGFGLLLSQVIVQAYHGDVSCVESSPAGTTMAIVLPIEVLPQEGD